MGHSSWKNLRWPLVWSLNVLHWVYGSDYRPVGTATQRRNSIFREIMAKLTALVRIKHPWLRTRE